MAGCFLPHSTLFFVCAVRSILLISCVVCNIWLTPFYADVTTFYQPWIPLTYHGFKSEASAICMEKLMAVNQSEIPLTINQYVLVHKKSNYIFLKYIAFAYKSEFSGIGVIIWTRFSPRRKKTTWHKRSSPLGIYVILIILIIFARSIFSLCYNVCCCIVIFWLLNS